MSKSLGFSSFICGIMQANVRQDHILLCLMYVCGNLEYELCLCRAAVVSRLALFSVWSCFIDIFSLAISDPIPP